MSQPYFSNQPTGKYYPQPQDPPYYPAQGGQGYYPQGPYPQGPYPPQGDRVYYDEVRQDNWWLTSLLALCCGCFLGEACCDQPCLCCVLPCPTVRF
ncbi:unnamed protein product [Cylicocyclus nassatus]|uniref:Cysteine-rich transmembrane CYSTM domain-containing protein n=1 Tax=Cylicocyclus nassatus TaxID=53992 RepID=A0AA36M7N1_CYLNA|nr:unnamed protein product [Cylicocyclus nassatus]